MCFAELKDPVKDKLKRFGLFAQFGEESFFPTIGAAVSSYLESHAVDWVDWEDAPGQTGTAQGSSNAMNWLLLFVPIAIGLEIFAPERHLLVFAASALAILPLAAWMGRATEQLAERMGEGVGGLLNATFGNAAELIIALAALRAGLHDVVKASIAGSIVGNILLVLGAAMLAGGLRRPEQHFNPAGARSQATMLTLAAIALVLPAAFQAAPDAGRPKGSSRLASRSPSCCSSSICCTSSFRW